jgi:CopG family transcriptional regulator, nickel-responsive regulator
MSTKSPSRSEHGVSRFSVSLPPDLLQRLDAVVVEQRMPSRSAAIAEMVHQHLVAHYEQDEQQVMAGTLTIVYDNANQKVRTRLSAIEREYLKEVIAAQHVFLENEHYLEVLLVQGPAGTLRALHQAIKAQRGVKTASLTLTAALLPPLH